MNFWKKFTDLCNANDIKPTTALKAMGISPGNMERWRAENGSNIIVGTLEKIAEYFKVPIVYFFGEVSEPREMNKDDNLIEDLFSRTVAELLSLSDDQVILSYEISKIYKEIRLHIGYSPDTICCPKCGGTAIRLIEQEEETPSKKVCGFLGDNYTVCASYARPLISCPSCGVTEIVKE